MSDLFSWAPLQILGDRDGVTFDPARDGKRLNKQAQDTYNLMADGRWRTLSAISRATGHPEASVSARLRDLRKPRFGGYTVNRRFDDHARVWEYQLVA
jgi:hypothetical protein